MSYPIPDDELLLKSAATFRSERVAIAARRLVEAQKSHARGSESADPRVRDDVRRQLMDARASLRAAMRGGR